MQRDHLRGKRFFQSFLCNHVPALHCCHFDICERPVHAQGEIDRFPERDFLRNYVVNAFVTGDCDRAVRQVLPGHVVRDGICELFRLQGDIVCQIVDVEDISCCKNAGDGGLEAFIYDRTAGMRIKLYAGAEGEFIFRISFITSGMRAMGIGSVSRTLQSGISPPVTRTLLVRVLLGSVIS